jgi:hypothetical protein
MMPNCISFVMLQIQELLKNPSSCNLDKTLFYLDFEFVMNFACLPKRLILNNPSVNVKELVSYSLKPHYSHTLNTVPEVRVPTKQVVLLQGIWKSHHAAYFKTSILL